MTPIVTRAFARAGLLGNPSDGYGGKTISLIVSNFWAEAILTPSPILAIDMSDPFEQSFSSIAELRQHVVEHGYYGGERLVKAAIKRFADYCDGRHELTRPCFRIAIRSNIPLQVGLAGSSAIIIATLRGLMQWYEVTIPPYLLASLALSAELDELGIPAGLQDRVVQAYEGIVYMDFARSAMKDEGGLVFGSYEPIELDRFPNFYISYSTRGSEPTEVLHGDLKRRYQAGEPAVLQAMDQWAEFAREGKDVLLRGDDVRLAELIDANFDLRRRMCRLNPHHVEMVETARGVGCSAKYCGSGGAILGTYFDEAMFNRLGKALHSLGCHVFKPHLRPV